MDKDLYGNMKMVWCSNKFLFDLLENSFRFLKIKSPPTGSKCVDGASIDIERFEKCFFLNSLLSDTENKTRDYKILWEDHKKGPHEKVEKWLPVANKTIWFNFSFHVCVGPRATEDSGFLLFCIQTKSSTTVVAFVSYGRSMVPLSYVWIL